MSPELKDILSEDSNIMKFQKKFNIIEHEECTKDFFNFVFDIVLDKVEYKALPENTKLQKELKRKLIIGEKLHLGLGFLKEIDNQ